MAKDYKNFLLAGLAGLILGLAYPNWGFSFGFLAWLGLIPLFLSLKNSKNSFWIGSTAGLIYFLIVFRWYWDVYSLDGFGINSKVLSITIIFVVYSISCLAMAVFWGIWAYAAKLNQSGKLKFIFAPSAFVLVEFLRSIGFGLLWFGSGTLFGPHWTMGNIAYGLSNNHLALWLSSFVGIYGLDFLIVLINLLIFEIIVAKKFNLYFRLAGGLIIFIFFAIISPRINFGNQPTGVTGGNKINFALIQTNQPTKINYSPEEKVAFFKEQLELLNEVGKNHPQAELIVFPETSEFFKDLSTFLSTQQVQDYFGKLFTDPHLIISGARVTDDNGRSVSRVFSLDTKNDIVGYYDKRLLAPMGEFLPSPIKLALNLFAKNSAVQFGKLRELSVGQNKSSQTNFDGKFSVSPLVCSELVSPSLARSAAKSSDVIVGMASSGIFHGKGRAILETLAMSKFRAAENRKPLVLAVNMGLSYAIDSRGDIDSIAFNQESQILTGDIIVDFGRSWYNKLGDWPILLVSGFILGIIIRKKISGNKI